ncbi:hypothetical protein C1H46_035991 [Malus baccata]|uniref:Uncharacterized protein n=1 Tax=Malus baccata TaxID=106549 RepID=A0A540KW39_MALBA|nr:hypothetical protein C1H46_035991 [Malus baccata]
MVNLNEAPKQDDSGMTNLFVQLRDGSFLVHDRTMKANLLRSTLLKIVAEETEVICRLDFFMCRNLDLLRSCGVGVVWIPKILFLTPYAPVIFHYKLVVDEDKYGVSRSALREILNFSLSKWTCIGWNLTVNLIMTMCSELIGCCGLFDMSSKEQS